MTPTSKSTTYKVHNSAKKTTKKQQKKQQKNNKKTTKKQQKKHTQENIHFKGRVARADANSRTTQEDDNSSKTRTSGLIVLCGMYKIHKKIKIINKMLDKAKKKVIFTNKYKYYANNNKNCNRTNRHISRTNHTSSTTATNRLPSLNTNHNTNHNRYINYPITIQKKYISNL